MKKIVFKTVGILVFVFSFMIFNQVNAQTNNSIEEVKISNNDGFRELRNLVINHFDFNNPNFSEGIINTDVAFSIAENGKITNVHAKGDCKYINAEIENVLNHLQYKISKEQLGKNMIAASSYVMPVKVMISER